MSAYTPGPWAVVPADADYRAPDKDDFAIVAPDLTCVGTVWDFSAIGEANARLIAAAPDLLDALKQMLTRYTQLVNCGDCGNWDPEQELEVRAARDAIAKAQP